MVKVLVLGVMVVGIGWFYVYGLVFDGVVGVVYVLCCILVEVDLLMVVNGYLMFVDVCVVGVVWI